ncbi:unnamed protein product [Arctogadus glacialis]
MQWAPKCYWASQPHSYQVRVTSMCAQWQLIACQRDAVVMSPSSRQEATLGEGAPALRHQTCARHARHKVSVSALLPAGTRGRRHRCCETTLCRAAKADLVFWSTAPGASETTNFQKIINFLYSTAGALDEIGPTGTQVAIAQFSDDPPDGVQLNSYSDKQSLLDAIKSIAYQGRQHQDRAHRQVRSETRPSEHTWTVRHAPLNTPGQVRHAPQNTKTGRAIAHVKDVIFTEEGGMRRGVPNVLVVLTDGRSQDDVNKVSKEMQLEGHIVFAIGFADADYGELVSIASSPSERHVFFVDDLDAFQKIEEKLVTFGAKQHSDTCPSVPRVAATTSTPPEPIRPLRRSSTGETSRWWAYPDTALHIWPSTSGSEKLGLNIGLLNRL